MSDQEYMKEYLRRAYMDGALDLGRDRETLEGFLRIFAGEMEATIAIDHATYLTRDEQIEMLKIAKPTPEGVGHHRAWIERIHST